jgi:hypothetical protein
MAFESREENKDAYDLYYVLKYYGAGVHDIFDRLAPLLRTPEGRQAINVLQRHFLDHDAEGPRVVAHFIRREADEEIQADVVTLVTDLLRAAGVEPT